NFYPVEGTEVVKGGGIVSSVAGHRVAVGNVALMEKENVTLSKKVQKDVKRFEQQGNSLVLTAVDGELKVLMRIRDQVRPGVKAICQESKNSGWKSLVLRSGDTQARVAVVAAELGLTEAHGHTLPEDKAAYIGKLQQRGQIVA